MKSFEIPKSAFNSLKKPNKLLIFSFLTIIIANCITIFGFSYLELKIKIILSLVIICFVLLADVIILYTQYYMYFYQSEYLNKIYSLININVDNISAKLDELKEENSDIRNSVSENLKEIEFLKSKLL